MKTARLSASCGGAAVLGVIVSAPAAWAQQANDVASFTLEEIVVTATKRAEKLQDVPLAISAVTGEDIAARGYTQFADYLNSVPGVYFEDAGPGVSQIRIRGLSAVEGDMPSTVATYFGETLTSVQTLQGGKPNPRLVDIERVEVLRGPQGTLFGANALAGVVRIIPASANVEDYQANVGVRGFTTAHSDDESYHVEGMINLPLVANRFAVRMVGYKDEIAGFVDNVFAGQPEIDYTALGEALLGLPEGSLPPGTLLSPEIGAFTSRDVNAEDTSGGRISVAFQASERLRFDLLYTKQEVTLDSEPHTTPAAGEYAQSRGLDAFKRAQFAEDLDIASFTARYDWDNLSLIAASSRTELDRGDSRDATGFTSNQFGVPLPWGVDTAGEGKLETHELRLQSNGGSLGWLLGAFYLDQDSDWTQEISDFTCPSCLPTLLFGQDFILRGSGFIGEEQRAVFGEVTYEITPRWRVGLGARYLETDLVRRVDTAEGLLAQGTSASDLRRSADEFNPAFHLRFRPSDDLTLYLQAARGFRSSVPNLPLPSSCSPEAEEVGVQPTTDPDTLWNYEIGVKSVLADGRAQLNAAIYEAKWEGVQLPPNLSCGFGAVVNGGDATGRGVELEFTAQLGAAWRLNLSGAYNDTEFDRVVPQTGFRAGERLPGSADRNFGAGVQYDFEIGSGEWSGFARADYVYVGDVRLTFQSGEVTQDAFGTANLRVGFHNRGLALELFGRNLADERAVLSTGLPEEGGNQVLLRPRELGVELRYSFR